MRLPKAFKFGALALLAVVFLYSGSALTQSESQPFEIQLTNVCSQGVISLNLISLEVEGSPFPIQATVTNVQIQPGQTITQNGTTTVTPTRLRVLGSFNGESFAATFEPLQFNVALNDTSVAGGCLQALVQFNASNDGGGTTQPPTTGTKPIVSGQTLDQVIASLSANGIPLDVDGSQANPKIGNVDDPQLLRLATAFSAQLIWVSAPGQLRSVINWDNPNVDLDLLVFGLGACFQLNGTGLLAETCDRAPFGPVVGNVFAVIVINWSAANQAFVLSLSS